MSVKVENLEKNMAKLTVEVPAAEFEKATEEAYRKQKGKIQIPGFRKGHAPKVMIEQMYGASVFYEEAVDILLDKTYPDAAKESGLEITSRPEIAVEQMKKGEPFIYTATVALRPAVELGQYKGVKAEKADASVTAKDVDAELKRVQQQNARLVSIDDPAREVKKDDIVTIDFEGFVDGKPFEGGKGEDYALTIGAHQFIDTFEEQVEGHKVGDEFEVHVTFPSAYHAKELANKPATFKVKVKEIKERQLPEIDDDFAGEVSEFDTLKEYKASLKKELKARKDKMATQQNENSVVKVVVDEAKIDVPNAMIEEQVDRMINDYAQRLKAQGIPLEQYLSITGTSMEQLRGNVRKQAEINIRTRLVLEEIVKQEKIEASEERVNEEIKKMAEQYSMKEDQIRDLLGEEGLKSMKLDLACQEAIDFLVAEAELVEPEKKEKKSSKKADKEKAEAKEEAEKKED